MARAIPALLVVALVALGCRGDEGTADGQPERALGDVAQAGGGTAQSYADFDDAGRPLAVGLILSSGFLEGLPTEPSDRRHCFDRDGNGTVDPSTECSAWHEWVIPLPGPVASRSDIPFKWALLNWNPGGHIPPHVYDVPHFDMHFYIEPIENVFSIEPGPCGPEFVRCDQFEMGRKPVPPNYVAPDYQNVDAVAPAMGNHLIDPTSPEFNGGPFTRTWIYGTYDGRITFYEEMVTRAFLLEHPSECFPIKAAPAVAIAGLYPTALCYGFDPSTGEQTVSMQDFVLREASPPDPVPEAVPAAD